MHRRDDLVPESLIRSPKLRHGGRHGSAVQGSALVILGASQAHGRMDVLEDALPGPGHFIVDFPLLRGKGMFKPVVFHIIVGQTSCRIDAHGLHVLRDHLHDAYATGRDVLHESPCISEWGLCTPKAQPRSVGKVHNFRGACRRDVEDPCLGKHVLKLDTGKRSSGGLCHAPSASYGYRVAHVVRFIEGDHAVKIGTQPVRNLLQPGDLLPFGRLLHLQSPVSDEADALLVRDVGMEFHLSEVKEKVRVPSDALDVACCILD
ncbi:MAG: hypothetical protein BWY00_01695 [Firmicutes bacterium ADurb.Bin153]|nr:MAG: hypothetical protein BWY00_01695 [Firmicutes bacterium ADurb.Bin153]